MIKQDFEILLVEDDDSDAEMTIQALNANNLANKLLHLKDGADALDFIFGEGEYAGREVENAPNVVLLDLKMPKVNGIEVLRRMKTDERTKKIPWWCLLLQRKTRIYANVMRSV